jgi:arylsulfatase A-like enzyme
MNIEKFRKFALGCMLLPLSTDMFSQAKVDSRGKMNVLFITIDDMNDWTSLFDKNNPIKTPNIERLASKGAFFSRAYCSSPASNPDRDNTIIILWSDHGFHLGEKEHFEKFALWEKTTHIPFIIVAPGLTTPGEIISKPVDMTCIYPTLSELCGLKIPASVDGYSLVPLLKDPETEVPPALMTYMKNNHAVRTEKWRFIHYADGTRELYDHETDPNEWYNVAGSAKNQDVIKDLMKYIPVDNAEQVNDLKK